MSQTQVHQEDAQLDHADGSVSEAPDAQVSDNPEQHERLVPVSEAKKYRKRAQAAEKILEDFKVELAEKDDALHKQQQTITDMQRQRLIDELLVLGGQLVAVAGHAVVLGGQLVAAVGQDVANGGHVVNDPGHWVCSAGH